MATGLGKTWLAAFDSDSTDFKRILFVAHREEILRQSLATFRRIRPNDHLGLYTGQNKVPDAEVLFASIQTLGRKNHLNLFSPDHFDYIVVDEFHHAAAHTYAQLIRHFEPAFMLGLTATPERLDGSSILALCEDNLVYRCDAHRGIEQELLAPFHYYGIADDVDYSNIPWRSSRFDEESLTAAVATDTRAQHALDEWRDKGGARTLAFCCSVRHADFMRDFFQQRGVAAAAVHSASNSDPRPASLERLDTGDLEVIFAVDIFNEGVDLPHIDTVMMLRPTESPVIWMQQFGRGLRKAEGKDRVTVLDYIGNHRIFLLKIRALHDLNPGDANIRQVLQLAQARQLTLPPGCEITYDLRTIQILEGLISSKADGAKVLELWYRDTREREGERPLAGRAFREGYNPRVVRRQFSSWLLFVSSMDDLSESESALVRTGRSAEFLAELETTRMTRSFKMLTLRAMLEQGLLSEGITINHLTEAFRRLLQRSPAIRKDLGDAAATTDDLRRSIENNPIDAWVGRTDKAGRPFFSYEHGTLRLDLGIAQESAEDLERLVGEIVDWRLVEYFRRTEDLASEVAFACKVSHSSSGNPILFLPDRETHPNVPSGWTDVSVGGETLEANFVKIAVNVVRRNHEDDNILPDILRRWFGEDAGRSGTNQIVLMEREGEGWTLTPQTARPPEETPLEVGRSYMRAEIPPLFGLTFRKQTWEQGFVLEGDHIFLLVTLDKSGMSEAHQYGDRFLSADRLEWQSQNRHTRNGRHGLAIRNHNSNGRSVHLFTRKLKKLGSKAAPFIYLGDLDFESWQGEKPITVKWKLRNPLTPSLMTMFQD